MSDDFHRKSAGLRGRIRNMVARAVISWVNDAAKAQAVQIELLADETQDSVERYQNYGFTSVPLPGAEAIVVFAGGLRSHGIVIATEDRRYRLLGMAEGEVALYDDLGQKIHLTRDGIVIETAKPVTIRAESVLVDAASIDLGGEGGPAVARIGDTVADGVITSGSDKVRAA